MGAVVKAGLKFIGKSAAAGGAGWAAHKIFGWDF